MNEGKPIAMNLDQQRALIDQLAQLIAERSQEETSLRLAQESREKTSQSQYEVERQRLVADYQRRQDELQEARNRQLSEAVRVYERAVEQATQQYDRLYRETVRDAERAIEEAEEAFEDEKIRIRHEYDEQVRVVARELHDFKEQVRQRREEIERLADEGERIVRRRRCRRAAERQPKPQGQCDAKRAWQEYEKQRESVRTALRGFDHHRAARFLASGSLVAIFVFSWIVALLAGAYFELFDTAPWLVVSVTGVFALGISAIVYVATRPTVVHQTLSQYRQLQQAVADAQTGLHVASKLATAEADRKRIELKRQRNAVGHRAEKQLEERKKAIAHQREQRLKEMADQLQKEKVEAGNRRQQSQEKVNREADERQRQLQQEHEQRLQRLDERHGQEMATAQATFGRRRQRLVQRWTEGIEGFERAVEEMNRYCQEQFPSWSDVDWESWSPPREVWSAVRFGEYRLGLDMFEKGISDDPELRPKTLSFSLPAFLSLEDRPTLLMEAWGEGRQVANRAIQNVMLRLLTSMPPAKVQFTIIDPAGLGQNFSAFMHLADFDEKLVNHRIWTEPTHINQRLADLTEHMEGVIQTYLRNEYSSIAEYNRRAGEIAEPLHVLVVANFPAGFSEEAAQRLLSITASGARCGVCTLISTDGRLDLPRNFHLGDLEAQSVTLMWDGSRFCWNDSDLKDLPLKLDQPPADERMTEIIRVAGDRAQEAGRVEVPFKTVVPPVDSRWCGDARSELVIPLGRAGATKLQSLVLGKGTSQHVLISGKTGSGKSTLLHVLITNTALRYGPDEVEFYLIDFKKGVEFKPYATWRMPHARVVAIESEREFGMSVLERLDGELRRRGDMFRQHGVQDIEAFRNLHPHERMPRILLVIDEFQEFFVRDDKLAQNAALLLDRLVRQGRAFGIHVLLGSQTLAGAYSLARSTLGQMAVRIALQCSEADSHLILSEDNTAARLLRRPGEAIYNDANGLFEGNHPFQVVWLSAAEQEFYLTEIQQEATERHVEVPEQIVFEGNQPADPAQNRALCAALSESPPSDLQRVPRAWLGAAVSIKEPTSVAFHRQSGSNLLMVGQQEEEVLGVLANALISLVATMPVVANGGSSSLVLDGMRPDSPETGFWKRLGEILPVEIESPARAAERIAQLAEEVRRRHEQETAEPSLFLVVYHLARFRDLRRSESDFGFSGFGDEQPVAADQQLREILREGPAVGVHTLIWSDTYNNVTRTFDRQSLRDFDWRVLFQMSATDSSNLMDSPAAGQLGVHRALLYSEERGQFEKFRPYAIPSDEWLQWVRERLAERSASPSVTDP